MLDFPYSADDEPGCNWTIEQIMHWWLLQAHAESNAACEEIITQLSKQLEQGKTALWEDHKQVTKIMNDEITNENSDPQPYRHSNTGEKQISPDQSSDILRVDIIAGEYQGTSYDLQPKSRAYSWVGRSQGKKFREKGISLPKDLEVSTTHGRFERQRSKFFYVDTESTNGSKLGDMELEPNAPIELKTGMEITIGQTVMKVTVPY